MSNITPGHVRVFQAIRSQLYDNITLASCFINDEPGAAIVMIDEVGEGKIAVMPLFVGITPRMKLTFPGEGDADGGGGPKTPREVFDANKAAARPAPRLTIAFSLFPAPAATPGPGIAAGSGNCAGVIRRG